MNRFKYNFFFLKTKMLKTMVIYKYIQIAILKKKDIYKIIYSKHINYNLFAKLFKIR